MWKSVESFKGLLHLRFLMVPLSHLPVQLLEAIRAAAGAEGLSHMDIIPRREGIFLHYVPWHL